MSWLVQHLIKNTDIIRSQRTIDSDEYNDLLVVESEIKRLYSDGLLSDLDLWVVDLMSNGKSLKDLEKEVGKNRVTISKTFVQICDRIAFFLGGYFTNDGFIDHMVSEYKLSLDDVEKLKDFMTGKFRHKLIRKKNLK